MNYNKLLWIMNDFYELELGFSKALKSKIQNVADDKYFIHLVTAKSCFVFYLSFFYLSTSPPKYFTVTPTILNFFAYLTSPPNHLPFTDIYHKVRKKHRTRAHTPKMQTQLVGE